MKQISLQINGLNDKNAKSSERWEVKQISLQINGLNIKLANGGKENERKNRSFTDQWFKLRTKHQNNDKKHQEVIQRATEKGRKKTKWADFKARGRTATEQRQKIKRQQSSGRRKNKLP